MSGYPGGVSELCKSFDQAAFNPARSADGAPALGVLDVQLLWLDGKLDNRVAVPDLDLPVQRLPAGLPIHPIVQTAIQVDAAGKVEACNVAVPSGSAALDDAACKAALQASPVKPAIGSTMAKASSIQSFNVGFGAYTGISVPENKQGFGALGMSGPYYPDRALRLDVSGYAILECTSDAKGILTECVTKDVGPRTFGFDYAAQLMAKRQWMKAASGSTGRVLVRVDFPPAPNFLQRRTTDGSVH